GRLIRKCSRQLVAPRMVKVAGCNAVAAFSSCGSICGDIFISWGPRFSYKGDTAGLNRCFCCPSNFTLCVNPHLLFCFSPTRSLFYAPHLLSTTTTSNNCSCCCLKKITIPPRRRSRPARRVRRSFVQTLQLLSGQPAQVVLS